MFHSFVDFASDKQSTNIYSANYFHNLLIFVFGMLFRRVGLLLLALSLDPDYNITSCCESSVFHVIQSCSYTDHTNTGNPQDGQGSYECLVFLYQGAPGRDIPNIWSNFHHFLLTQDALAVLEARLGLAGVTSCGSKTLHCS